MDYGETLEHAAVREAREETSLRVTLVDLLGVYSDPKRDPRSHTISAVYIARARGRPKARDDAKEIGVFTEHDLPPLVFDHKKIVADYFKFKKIGRHPKLVGR